MEEGGIFKNVFFILNVIEHHRNPVYGSFHSIASVSTPARGCVFVYMLFILTTNSLVTAVPFPLMPGPHWEEVCCSLVLHSLWEAQQDSVVQVTHTGKIRRAEGKTKTGIE